MSDLGEQQEALVRALVAGGVTPAGFDDRRIDLTRRALLRKRARAVAAHWPALGATPDFHDRFAAWAEGRPAASAHDEGPAFARSIGGELSPAARVELVLAGHRRLARDATAVVVRLPLLGTRRFGVRHG
jgi:hypothetical protein